MTGSIQRHMHSTLEPEKEKAEPAWESQGHLAGFAKMGM